MGLMTRKTDERIRHEILSELTWDSRVTGSDVAVGVDHGVVTLTGAVDTYAKKRAAQEAAHRVLGVTDVANDLEVKVAKKFVKTDTEIAHAVRHALEWDVLVPDSQIQSNVTCGRVTLEGTVDRLREREDAEAAVRQLAGVCGVSNMITVSPSQIAPHDVCQTIEEVLARRAHREASGIDVRVHDGVVTLTGEVHSWAEKQAILGAVGHAQGIRTVDDKIRVNPCD
jgi:osmotically-inducible protein OsmY